MHRRFTPLLAALVLSLIAPACGTLPPTLASSSAITLTPTAPAVPTRFITPVATSTPSPAPVRPTLASQSTPVPAQALEWRYLPNVSDLRSITTDESTLWIAALSGLVRYRPADGQYQVWTTADGLVDNTCESVVLWHATVWVGTQGGISRYDPATAQWRSYTTADGLPGLHNTVLYVDPYADALWAGTLGGLAAYDSRTDRWIEQTPDGVSFEGVASLAADPDFLWIATGHDKGMWRLDKRTGEWQDASSARDLSPVRHTMAAGRSLVWALSARGTILGYDHSAERWYSIVQLDDKDVLYPPRLIYGEQALWIGYTWGWMRYQVDTGEITRIRYPSHVLPAVQGVPAFASHKAWFPTRFGLYALDLSNLAWSAGVPIRSPQAVTRVLFADRSLLVDTGDQLGMWDPHYGTWQPIRQHPGKPLQGQPTAARKPDAPDLWLFSPPIGAPSLAVTPTVWHYPSPDSLPVPIEMPDHSPTIRLLPLVDQNALWFLADHELLAYSLEQQHWHRFTIAGETSYLSGSTQEPGAIWLIREGNTLLRFDTFQHRIQALPIPFGAGWRHIVLAPNTIWLGGGSSTVLAYDRTSRQWSRNLLDEACVGHQLSTLQVDERSIWAGGERGVARYYLDTGLHTCYTRDAGMLDDQVSQIARSGDWVWFVHPWRGLWGLGPSGEAKP